MHCVIGKAYSSNRMMFFYVSLTFGNNDFHCQGQLGWAFKEFEPGTNREVRDVIEALDVCTITSNVIIKITSIDDSHIDEVDSYFWKYEKVDLDLWYVTAKNGRVEPSEQTDYVHLSLKLTGKSPITGKHMLVAQNKGQYNFMCVGEQTTQVPPHETSSPSPTTHPVTTEGTSTTKGTTPKVTFESTFSTKIPSTTTIPINYNSTTTSSITSNSTNSSTISHNNSTSRIVETTSSHCPLCGGVACNCVCHGSPHTNISKEREKEILNEIKDELVLNPRALSQSIRKLESAKDDRLGSRVVGGIGIVFISIPFGLILLSDCIRFLQFVMG